MSDYREIEVKEAVVTCRINFLTYALRNRNSQQNSTT